MKETAIHCDIREGDISFWFTNSAWMIWHWDVSVLALGATVLLFDGSPQFPKPHSLLDLLSQENADHFGTSGRFLATWAQQGVTSKNIPLPRLRIITTSGSPLSPTAARHVYSSIKQDVLLASVSGGTELNGCLCISCPVLPVYPGELQCAPLGLDAVVLNADGSATSIGEEGELCCLNPFPSQPLFFWNDKEGKKYQDAYFAEMVGIWVHGDFATRTSRGGFIIHGRSDVTLKPGGVRLGTGDYYEVIAGFGLEIEDSVVVGRVDSEGAEHVVLFVKMVPGKSLQQELIKKVKETIRTKLSPRHIPAEIVAVSGVPVNVNNKKLEKMVKLIINGKKVDDFSSIANAESVRDYQAYAKRYNQRAKL
jgi:acetoacetyl-CoA synthetase